MKRSAFVFSLLVTLLAGAAYADAPLNGIYTTAAGDLLDGRYSESWPDGGPGQIGNTVHAQSWDGEVLGTQWAVRCPSIAELPELIEDFVDDEGNGHRTYRTLYDGGEFWLSGDGVWGNGDPEYGGSLDSYVHMTTVQFENWVMVSQVTNAQMSGYFDGYGKCMQVTIANAAGEGSTGERGRSYPVFLVVRDGECVPDPTLPGEWGNVHSIILAIAECNTASESLSWSTIKNLYR